MQLTRTLFFVAAKLQRCGLPLRQPRWHLHSQPDGTRPEKSFPRHQELHSRQIGNGGRKRKTRKVAAFGSSPACRHGDEERHHISGGGSVPQDLHTEAREC